MMNDWKVGEVEMIQIDMKMPTNCLDCPACNEYLTCAIPVNGRKWGENDVREFGKGRPEWCPLKEQEPLAIRMIDDFGAIKFGCCPTCNAIINNRGYPKSCGCGQTVKWE